MQLPSENEIRLALAALARPHGAWPTSVDRYLYIQQSLRLSDVSKSAEFQLAYNGFYVVRRSIRWREIYFGLFEEIKNQEHVTFSDILQELWCRTGRLEPSFTSKLFATLKPDQPVIDSIVLGQMGLRLPYPSAANRAEKMVSIHSRLASELAAKLATLRWKDYELLFDQRFPRASKIAAIKKLDFILWQNRT